MISRKHRVFGRALAALAIVGAVALAAISCNADPEAKNSIKVKTLSGDVTVKSLDGEADFTVGMTLEAVYSDTDAVVSFIWHKVGDAEPLGKEPNFTPQSEGDYTVTARASGYHDKTSAPFMVGKIPAIKITDGGRDASASPAIAEADDKVTLTAGEKDGYRFDKWVAVKPDDLVIDETYHTFIMPAQAVEVRATWTAIDYDIKVDAGGAAGTGIEGDKTKANIGDEITLVRGDYTEHTFKAWQVTKPGTGLTVGEDGKFIMPASDVEITAVWDLNTYNTFLILGDGGSATTPPKTAKGDTVALPVPERGGYSFLYWRVDSGDVSPIPGKTFEMPGGDVTLTAIWDDFVRVAGGTFNMGASDGNSDERPRRGVNLSTFYMDKYPVTQKDYQSLMSANPSQHRGENRPVENVSWHEAVAYANRLSESKGLAPAYNISGANVTVVSGSNGYRLATEAQWEYAARARAGDEHYTYSGSNDASLVAVHGRTSGGTANVGTLAANSLGLYDMSGNVYEWVWDWYGDYNNLAANETDPQGPTTGNNRVLRGGYWGGPAYSARSTARAWNAPTVKDSNTGFRLVRPMQKWEE